MADVQISPADRDLAIRTMIGEEATPHGQAAVASTILNREQSGNYGGNTPGGVVLARSQYEPWSRNPSDLLKIPQKDPRYQRAAAIFDATASGKIPDLTGGATHFYAPGAQAALGRKAPSWDNGQGLHIGESMFFAPEGRVNYQPPGQQAIAKVAPTQGQGSAMASNAPVSATDDNITPAEKAYVADYRRKHPQDYSHTLSIVDLKRYHDAHAAPAPAISASPSPSGDSDPFEDFGVVAPTKATAAPASPVADSDPFEDFGVKASDAKAASAAPAPVTRSVPADAKLGANGLAWNADGGYDPKTGELVVAGKPMGSAPSQVLAGAAGVVNGVPIAGPALLAGAQKIAAASSALQPGAPDNALAQAQTQNQNYVDKSTAAYPITNTVGNVGGALTGTLPLMVAAPAAFGISKAPLVTNALLSGASGAALGGADAYSRANGGWTDPGALHDALQGAEWGGGFGAAAPFAGKAIGMGIDAASNALSRTTPAARNISNVLSEIGMTPEQARAKLAAMGPNATLADIDPALTTEAGGLASMGGQPTSVLKTAMGQRAAGADDRMAQLVHDTLGPKPDAQKIVSDIRAREGVMATDSDTARAAIDSSMGEAKDPHAVLRQMVQERSAAAKPLYEKAFEGGSTALLTDQFEKAFGDAVNTSSQAAKGLAAARQAQLLARAKVSNAGENVYAANGALEESRQADAAVAQAEKAASSADTAKQGIVERLRQAQADGSANAPGAVWSPRIQQFLDDPIMQPALAKGVKIQRLESLANGEKFDPTEFAITGQDDAGNPIVGKVPNMRTLNVAKKGLDSMVQDAKDPITGRLSEEGVAIDKVRSAFLQHLDSINPDYAAARQSWAGPTQTHEAFNKGLSIFQTRSGPTGVNSTPGALKSWLATASDGEKEAAKLGARSAFEQQMASASDPASKAAALANKEVNRQKLTAVLGPDEAGKLIDRLNFKYEDPAGQAFEKGMNLFKQREGLAGIEDTPDALRNWLKTASPAEIEAHRQGARQAIEQSISSAAQGDVSKARSLFAKNTANREKLDAIFPNAGKLFDGLDNELRMRATEQRVAQNSATAERQAVHEKYRPGQSNAVGIVPAIIGEAGAGAGGALGMSLLSKAYHGGMNALTASALSRLTEGTARGLSATGALQDQFLKEIARAHRASGVTNALSDAGSAGANALLRSLAPQSRNALAGP